MHDAVPNLPSTDAPLTKMRSKGALFALTPLFVVSAAWSALSFWLFVDGQQPSGPSVFSPAAHYLWQAVLLPMAVVFAFVGAEKVVKAIARLTRDEVIGIRFPLAVALATAQLLGIVIPDIAVYSTEGFSALGAVVIWTLPTAFGLGVLGQTVVLRRWRQTAWGRAIVASVLSTLMYFFLLSLVVR